MKLVSVKLSDIDVRDTFYKISRWGDNERLVRSIARSGVLRPPLMHKKGKTWQIISGFNRVNAAKTLGMLHITVMVPDSVDRDLVLSLAAEKEYHHEIGPVGKARLVKIINSFRGTGSIDHERLTHSLGIPLSVLHDDEFIDRVLSLPHALGVYIDEKNINFKIIKKLISMPDGVLERISGWVSSQGMKVNIFRNLIDILDDIYRRDGHIPAIDEFVPQEDESRRDFEQELYRYYFTVRFPRYSRLMNKAEAIRDELLSKGFTVDFPVSFEGNTVSLSFSMQAGERSNDIVRKIATLDSDTVERVLELMR